MDEMKKKDLLFVCKKCEHNLFISNCGEEAEDYWIGLWIYTRIYDRSRS